MGCEANSAWVHDCIRVVGREEVGVIGYIVVAGPVDPGRPRVVNYGWIFFMLTGFLSRVSYTTIVFASNIPTKTVTSTLFMIFALLTAKQVARLDISWPSR